MLMSRTKREKSRDAQMEYFGPVSPTRDMAFLSAIRVCDKTDSAVRLPLS